MYEHVKTNLRRLLAERNMTVADLVRATDLPRMHVYYISNGIVKGKTGEITAENIQTFASVLNVDTSEITGGISTPVETLAQHHEFPMIILEELPVYLNDYISRTGGGSALFAQRSGLSSATIDIVRITKHNATKPDLLEQSIEAARNLTDEQIGQIEQVLKTKIRRNNVFKRLTRSTSSASTVEHATVEVQNKRQRTLTRVSQAPQIAPAPIERQPSTSSSVSSETLPNDATVKLDQILGVLKEILERPTPIVNSNVPSSQPTSSSNSEQAMPSSSSAPPSPQLPAFLPYMPMASGNLYQMVLLNQACQQALLSQLTSSFPSPSYAPLYASPQPNFFGHPTAMQQGPVLMPQQQQYLAALGYNMTTPCHDAPPTPEPISRQAATSPLPYQPTPLSPEVSLAGAHSPQRMSRESYFRPSLGGRIPPPLLPTQPSAPSPYSENESDADIVHAQALLSISTPNSPLLSSGSPVRTGGTISPPYFPSIGPAATNTNSAPGQSAPLLGFSLGNNRR
jgi:transcriptional regulator with XRE-family HTH domain